MKAIDFSDETVRFFGGTTATVTGHVRVVSAHSPPVYDDTFLEVWVLEKGAWRWAAWRKLAIRRKKRRFGEPVGTA